MSPSALRVRGQAFDFPHFVRLSRLLELAAQRISTWAFGRRSFSPSHSPRSCEGGGRRKPLKGEGPETTKPSAGQGRARGDDDDEAEDGSGGRGRARAVRGA